MLNRRQRSGDARALPKSRALLAFCVSAALLGACFSEPSGDEHGLSPPSGAAGDAGSGRSGRGGGAGRGGSATTSGGTTAADGGDDGSGGTVPIAGQDSNGDGGEPSFDPFICTNPIAESLPARRAVTSGEVRPGNGGGAEIIRITKQALFAEFVNQECGDSGCHGGADRPNLQSPDAYQVTIDSFDQRPNLGSEALERILSSDPELVMPPGSGDGSKRGPNHPLRRLGERLLAWQEAGFPDSFEITGTGEPVNTDLPDDPYVLSPELGNNLSNLGSCIPHRPAMLTRVENDVLQKDAMFAGLETSDDLPDTIFETDLVSLDSTELARRSVFSYAPTYPLFSDHAGKMRYVRVPAGKTIHYNAETRDFDIPANTRFYKTFLKAVKDKDGNVGHRKMETRLIVSRPAERLADGRYVQRSLRAAYAWDKDERMARRVKDPFRDGTAAADRLCAYVVDESTARDPAKNPIQQPVNEFCTYMTAEEVENPASGKIRHYAIPSTERCDQCHMGAPNHSYILGFNPWQVDRRPEGEGGVYEAPKDDELTQLARLIEYGVITGIAPGQEKLEESQGARKPRNDHELKAQAYMIGNCAFCHNPSGFPVVQNPVLEQFELYPNEDGGGIFQFPLEKFSPRAKANTSQAVRIPYITPAFGDFDFAGESNNSHIHKKSFQIPTAPVVDADDYPADWNPNLFEFTYLGPWRSLIWRNVYTPFTYQEDGTIFVHMPRNSSGYDCRAQRIMANWMLSIPSTPKTGAVNSLRDYDQPVTEVRRRVASEREYEAAVFAAEQRVKNFNHGVTGSWCPDDDDIVDPLVVNPPLDPVTQKPKYTSPPDLGITGPRLVSGAELLPDAVPDHGHWVVTDTTDPAERWVPRRGEWKDLIATREATTDPELARVIDQLQTVHVSPDFDAFATELLPMGLYHASCQDAPELASEPRVSELAADGGPLHRWLQGGIFDEADTPSSQAKVHHQSRGEAVFRAICQNCHGRAADSRSPLADTIVELTGGKTRVANFMAGLLGPTSAPGAFARDEFLVDLGATPDDWQARYVLFMGLGGTSAELPQVVLNLVGTSPFYGAAVTAPGGDNPNMLGSAQKLCAAMLTAHRVLPAQTPPAPQLLQQLFVKQTGHYELWESLCSRDNPPIVHVFEVSSGKLLSSFYNLYRATDDLGHPVYPPDWPVGNQTGRVERGIGPDNLLPWCVNANTPAELAFIESWGESVGLSGANLPLCPPALFAEAVGQRVHRLAMLLDGPQLDVPFGNQDFSRRWLVHGAMNAGLAALAYLRGFAGGELEPSRPYDFCLN